jgi:hypothetical protein
MVAGLARADETQVAIPEALGQKKKGRKKVVATIAKRTLNLGAEVSILSSSKSLALVSTSITDPSEPGLAFFLLYGSATPSTCIFVAPDLLDFPMVMYGLGFQCEAKKRLEKCCFQDFPHTHKCECKGRY